MEDNLKQAHASSVHDGSEAVARKFPTQDTEDSMSVWELFKAAVVETPIEDEILEQEYEDALIKQVAEEEIMVQQYEKNLAVEPSPQIGDPVYSEKLIDKTNNEAVAQQS